MERKASRPTTWAKAARAVFYFPDRRAALLKFFKGRCYHERTVEGICPRKLAERDRRSRLHSEELHPLRGGPQLFERSDRPDQPADGKGEGPVEGRAGQGRGAGRGYRAGVLPALLWAGLPRQGRGTDRGPADR